ncbi:MAG: hypothetical protein OQK46_02645 [Gammaproteobacteria bacterium]|nr:hypothetical protein [Gammaproteobacteria bacterium]
MEIMRFNSEGIKRFGQYLDSLTTDMPESFPELLLTEDQYIEVVGSDSSKLDNIDLTDKLKAAAVLNEIVEETEQDSAERDAGLWTWVSCYLFKTLCSKDKSGRYKPGQRAKWLAEPGNHQRYYRHYLASIWLIYRAHQDEPERTRALLSGPVNTPGDIFEQIASRIELVRNPQIMSLTRLLYWDDEKQTKKRGSGGKGPGSPRRFADILSQYERTWDLFSVSVDELAGLLPDEFSKFI